MGMREDAIEKLEKAMMLSEAANECGVVLGYGIVEDVIALLKAQEPVEPQEKREGDYKNLYCGACGRGIVGYVGHLTGKRLNVSDYCNKCGRAVKWD